MKKLVILIVLLFSSSFAFAEKNTGSISGIINYCDKGGSAGMQVFIPGKPHVVITGTDGRFIFTNVAVGDYSLNFMLGGKILNFNKWAEVSTDNNTSLDLINICDVENREANTNTGASTPTTTAAPAIFDKIDCSVIKKGTLFLINNGRGKCQDGKVLIKSCDAGFANCDKETSNGCEININSDNENCGGCFNACSSLDTCN